MATQNDTSDNGCPECGIGFDDPEELRDHFLDDHLVSKSDPALEGQEEPSPTPILDEDGSAEPAPKPRDGDSDPSYPVHSTETPGRTGKLADRLVVLLVVLLVGFLGTGVGLIYLDLPL